MLRLVFILALTAFSAFGAAPDLEGFVPSGAEQGSTNILTAMGKFDPWPPEVWVDEPGLQITATTNKGKFEIVVNGAAFGPHLIRFYNKDGASEPRFFMVNGGPELLEAEPNDHFTNANSIAQLGLVMNGQLNKRDDVDSFEVSLKQGQTLEAVVESYTFMAKVDAVLRLLTPEGVQLAWNHDFATFDPKLLWTATNDQKVIVQIFGFAYPAGSEIRLAGGDGCHYRLGLFLGPRTPEPELNASTNLTIPVKLHAALSEEGEEDVFKVAVRKDQWLGAEVRARAIGSPLDAWLAIRNEDGKELARNDDANGSLDPALEWKSTVDGEVLIAVGSLTRQRSAEFAYDLVLNEVHPGFRATFEKGVHSIKPGETNSVQLKLDRQRGHTNELEIMFANLPSGVTAICTNIPGKSGAFSVELVAAADAQPANQPVTFALRDAALGAKTNVVLDLVSRTENNGVPGGYSTLVIPEVGHLWLTVLPKEEKAEPKTASK